MMFMMMLKDDYNDDEKKDGLSNFRWKVQKHDED